MQDYNFSDLIWTKNVTRDSGNDWAYMEYHIGDVFDLNFSKAMGTSNPKLPLKNQLILLVQGVKSASSAKKTTYLTHIVAPVDDQLTFDTEGSHSIKRLVTVIARNASPLVKPETLDFKRPNRGKVCGLDLIVPFARTGLVMDLAAKQSMLWGLFTEKDLTAKSVISSFGQPFVNPASQAIEGREGYWEGRHKFYERDRNLIAEKKRLAILDKNLVCEVCSLDFSDRYGTLGEGFMECHHLFPIAKSGIRTNFLEDLALVCANCHRMLHRKNNEGQYHSVKELKDLVLGQSQQYKAVYTL
ncbi:HNH endonuclease [uncultured Pedobacter sp.]|uniref:HNH endonuclease n=1 Tax=uncultured Pedobacter sp. TaxID=246139 RepID=UPI0025D2381B|nr:HNH endonuclease [uncultured Pedobacter sp.]